MTFREPLLLPCLALCAGVALARFAPFSWAETLPGTVALLLLALLAVRWARRSALAACLCGIALLSAGYASSRRIPQAPGLSVADGETAIFEGCVTNLALPLADREKFELELAKDARAQITLYTSGKQGLPPLTYGSRVELTGKLRPVHNFQNPGSFDAVEFFARRRVFWNGSSAASSVKLLPGVCGNAAMRRLFAIRAAALARVNALFPGDSYSAAMMEAVLLGETSRLERAWTEDYRTTGTFHALVISGSHVAIISAVLLFLLRLLWLPQWAALSTAALVAWLYAGVTGWQAPVVRSAAGMTLYAVARVFYREGRLLNLLAAVAIGFLLYDPSSLFDASFQLSFLAVAGIALFVIPLLEATSGPLVLGCRAIRDFRRDLRLPAKTAQFRVELRLLAETLHPRLIAQLPIAFLARVCLYVYEVAATSLALQVCLALPMIWYFHRLSLSGVLANVMVLPALTVVVPVGFLAILTNSTTLGSFCQVLLSMSASAARWNASWQPDFRIPLPPLTLAVAFALSSFFLALRGLRRWQRWTGAFAVLILLLMLVIHPFVPRTEAGRFELTAIDVGQGDSLFAAFPNGKLMLVDAGGIANFGRPQKSGIDTGEDVVSPYLWTRSVKRLDVVVMTHAHQDHMGGLPAVIRNFRPGELWTGAVPDSEDWRAVKSMAEQSGVRIREMRRSKPFEFGGAKVVVLAPSRDYIPGLTPKNDDSLALRIEYGNTAFVLAGDMEKRTEYELLNDGVLRSATVLKVGHHGSRTSSTSEFLDALHPAFAVISDGFENSYGHPHPLTLKALHERMIEVLRTDELGLVTLSSDGRTIRVD